MDKFLSLLADKFEINFSRYKPSTLNRRIEKRVEQLHLKNKAEYYDYLESNSNEQDILLKSFLIGVTEFFRDRTPFKELEKVLKSIVANKKPKESVRIWSIGCATGEEPYSIAYLLSKIVSDKKEGTKVQIFATDINSNALKIARKGSYSATSVENLTKLEKESIFNVKGQKYEVKNHLRQMILFCEHDIIKDPPFVKIDLIVCRNLLIYFNQDLQREVFSVFHYSLNPFGFMLLGKSENIGILTDMFSSLDAKNKIFQKKKERDIHPLRLSKIRAGNLSIRQLNDELSSPERSFIELAKETLFNTYEFPFVIFDDDYEIIETVGNVRLYLGFNGGAMNSSLLKMINRELLLEFRILINKVKKTGIPGQGAVIGFELFDKTHYVRMVIKPLVREQISSSYFILIFKTIEQEEGITSELSKVISGEKDNKSSLRILELEHELAAAREHLQSLTDELELSKEELQSLNEELQSSNEELKSSNEEFETSNEELQSANEELFAANDELTRANEQLLVKEFDLIKSKNELKKSEIQFKKLFRNAPVGMLLTDLDGKILKSNEAFLKLLGYAENELLGKEIKKLLSPEDFNLIKGARKSLLSKKSGFSTIEHKYLTKTGKEIAVLEKISLERESNKKPSYFIKQVVDITFHKKTEIDLMKYRQILSNYFSSLNNCIVVFDERLNLVEYNPMAAKIFGFKKSNPIQGHNIFELTNNFISKEQIDICKKVLKTGEPYFAQKPVTISVRKEQYLISIQAIKVGDNLALIGEDVTKREQTELALTNSNARLELLINSINGIVWECDANTFEFNYISEQTKPIMGYSPSKFLKDPAFWFNHLHPDDRIWATEYCQKQTKKLKDHIFEYRFIDNKGKIIWIKDIVTVVAENKKPVLLRGIMYDVTKEKQIEQNLLNFNVKLEEMVDERTGQLAKANKEIGVLLNEMHHRVKNNLQIISSLLSLQSEVTPNAEVVEIINDSQNRIRSMSLIHESLYKKDSLSEINVKEYLKQLINERISSDAIFSEIRTKINVPPLRMPINTMVPLGLLMNELVTNSLKHAFKKKKNGTITVELDATVNGNGYGLTYSDNGSGFDKSNRKEYSLGTELIECFVSQLDGNFTVSTGEKGTKYEVSFKGEKN